MRIVLILLILVACGTTSPEERGIEVDRSIVKVYNQDKALLDLESAAEDHYEQPLGNAFEDAVIWWATTQCPYRDDTAVIYEGVCYHGRLWSCSEIYVALPAHGTTCGSALLHEYGHCLMMLIRGYGDANHTSDVWGLVEKAHARSCVREQGNAIGSKEITDRQIIKCGQVL